MNANAIVYVWPMRGYIAHLAAGMGVRTACGRYIDYDSDWASGHEIPTGRRICRRCLATQADVQRRAAKSR